MRILILNWRDIKNPKSGGAEVLTHEIAERLVKVGHKVTLFSSFFKNAKKEEIVDGVKIIRRGHPDARFLFSSVHFLAYKFYKKNEKNIDVVIDEVHGLPFFTSLYVKKRKIILICEVADELWITMFGLFFGFIGKLLETLYLRFMYKNVPYLTISDSTKGELVKKGVNPRNITVLPIGLSAPKKNRRVKKEKKPTLIFVGRISKSKGVEDAILALEKTLKENLDIRLWIVGNGDKKYIDYLKNMAKKLKILDNVTFWGYVPEEKKFELMERAHILLAPSVKEGWGLIVPEAAFVGTPSVVYNVLGLRDIVLDGVNGVIVKKNTPSEIKKEVIKILYDKNLYKKLRSNAKKSSLNYNWDNTARAALKVIKGNSK